VSHDSKCPVSAGIRTPLTGKYGGAEAKGSGVATSLFGETHRGEGHQANSQDCG